MLEVIVIIEKSETERRALSKKGPSLSYFCQNHPKNGKNTPYDKVPSD